MRSRFMSLALCLLVCCWPSVVEAQQPLEVPRDRPSTVMFVLQTPAAQRELRLDRKQLRTVSTLVRQVDKAATTSARQGNDRLWREATADFEKGVRESLSESQQRRLEQLVVQFPIGPETYAEPRMVEQLQLQPSQVQHLRFMQQQMLVALAQLNQQGLDPRQLTEARFALTRQAQNEAAANVLTDAQRALMVDLVGPRFDWTAVLMPGRAGDAGGP